MKIKYFLSGTALILSSIIGRISLGKPSNLSPTVTIIAPITLGAVLTIYSLFSQESDLMKVAMYFTNIASIAIIFTTIFESQSSGIDMQFFYALISCIIVVISLVAFIIVSITELIILLLKKPESPKPQTS